MNTKKNVSFRRYLLDGFARLVNFGAHRRLNAEKQRDLEERIYMSMKNTWEIVGKNMREALNQYGSEK
jgi:hypothetical protein